MIAVLAIYWSFPSDRWRQPFLLAANFFFYGWWNWKFTSLLFAAILISYMGALLVQRVGTRSQRGKYFMMGACTLLLGLLGYFKYTNFFLESLRGMIEHLGGHVGWSTLKILLPAGISFYIFQAISYVVSVYRGKLPAENSLVRLGVYLSFFPHLVAGPIIHAPTFLPQLVRKRIFDSAQFVEGCRKFALGFLYKAVFADNLAAPVDVIFKTLKDQSPLTIFGGCLGFYGQIYFDFAGYSLMAIGVANLLGYTLPDNFNFPYRATSLIEFWRRWHISLSTWLRDYVYIPLGGNRCSHARQYLNIIITMFLGGLWHGASWNFLLWGGVHGLALCLNHVWVRNREQTTSLNKKTLIKICSPSPILFWLLTQGTIFLCWIPFRAATLHDTILIFQKLGTLGTMTLAQLVQAGSFPWLLASLPLLFDMAFNGSEGLRTRWSLHSTLALYGVIAGALLIGLLFMHSGTVNFIYFQF
ncbi:MAG TPA: MBOAT family O-acyltransferase [Chthoniobacterales bacterium]|nr:MBOAT family O-acyltransferase [Chthoniobacterales bacterium]